MAHRFGVLAALGALSVSGKVVSPAIAQAKPVRIGILAPRSGIAAAPGENGIRASTLRWRILRLAVCPRTKLLQSELSKRVSSRVSHT
jgi:stage III sporulation protein SpoIIIAA